MDTFTQLRASFWNYVSPRKQSKKQQPVQQRRETRKQRHSIGALLRQKAVSPTKRTHQWLERPISKFASPDEPSTAAKKHRSSKVLNGRVTKPPIASRSPHHKISGAVRASPSQKVVDTALEEHGVEEYDLENDDTLVEEGSITEGNGDYSEDDDMNDATLVDDEAESGSMAEAEAKEDEEPLRAPVDREELRRQREAMVNANSAGWTSEENRLYRVITMRGFEPLFPLHWRMDFQYLPSGLFCHPDEAAFFNSASDSDFHATRSLYRLLSLGKSARERVLLRSSPEIHIKREIEAYIDWSEKDGAFAKKPHLPVIAFALPQSGEAAWDPQATVHLESQIRRKLKVLASRHRNTFTVHKSVETQVNGSHESTGHDTGSMRSATPVIHEFSHQPPTLYGVLILHTVVAIATYDSANLESPLRTVAILDLGKSGQDVWNGLAIGASVICARDWMRRCEPLRAQKELSDTSDDPDA